MTKRHLIGAILAGGESSRMGHPKAGTLFRGATFFEHVRDALLPLVDELVILGHGEGCDDDVVRLFDPEGERGPIAGISALKKARPECTGALVVSCDMPLLTTALLRPLLGEELDRSAAFFVRGSPCAFPLYLTRKDLLVSAQSSRRFMRFVEKLDLRRVQLPKKSAFRLSDINSSVVLDNVLGADDALRSIDVVHLAPDENREEKDDVCAEEPLEIRVRGQAIATLMRSPGHDLELVRGFCISERLVSKNELIDNIEHCSMAPSEESEDNVVDVSLHESVHFDLKKNQRHFFASSSCGVCGKATIENVMQLNDALQNGFAIDAKVLARLPKRLRSGQALFARTGGVHAAGLFDSKGTMLIVREDVGRHNAVDKVIGWALLNDIDLSQTILQVSGRVSFEIVQKALHANISAVSAISAPTSLAVDVARQSGVALIAFVRDGGRMNVYAGAERLV